MNKNIRVRFAPSPTGHLHVGNIRTAILNYLFAKKNSGTFVLRIEDTDAVRSTKESLQTIIDDFNWLGLDWDEGPLKGGKFGPYFQTDRYEIHKKYSQKLLDKGEVYRCFCSRTELDAEREIAEIKGIPYKYSGKCRTLSIEQIQKNLESKLQFVLRFKVKNREINFSDLIMGNISIQSETLGDFVITRTDGSPIYNFCCVVDDHLMEISHVIRGDGHLPNTPKQILIYEAFDWETPIFAHTPMILDENKKKLSKRKGGTSVDEFRNGGYLPKTLINFLSLLSWSSPSGDEILSLERLINEFDFKRMGKSGAVFDSVKLNWMNSVYIKDLENAKYLELAFPFLDIFPELSEKQKIKICEIFKGSIQTINEIQNAAKIFVNDFLFFDESNIELLKLETNVDLFLNFIIKIEKISFWNSAEIFQAIKSTGKECYVKGKNLFMPLRIALTNQQHGPELPLICEIFGKDKTIIRIKNALKFLTGNK